MKIQTVLAAALLAATALPAFAESEISLGYQHYSADSAGRADGAGLRYSGDYANGIEANLDLYTAEISGVELTLTDADLSWKWRDVVGPKVAHYALSADGLGVDTTYAGLTVGMDVGGFTLGADALTNVRGLDDSQVYAVRAGWKGLSPLKMTAEVRHETSSDTTIGTLGAKYDVRQDVFLESEYSTGETFGSFEADAAYVGVGFRF